MDSDAPGVQRGRRSRSSGRVPFKNVQLVGCRVPERPEVRGSGHDEVQAKDGQLPGDPPDGPGDAFSDVAAGPAGLGSDEREEAFAVGLTLHQVRNTKLGQTLIEPLETSEGAVVGKQPPVLLERVRVDQRMGARAGVPHMG